MCGACICEDAGSIFYILLGLIINKMRIFADNYE